MFFNAIIWDDSESNASSEILSEGSYAYFSFTGTKSDYRKFIHNIYKHITVLCFTKKIHMILK